MYEIITFSQQFNKCNLIYKIEVNFYEKSIIEKIPDNSHLVFLDVRSLYAIIPNSKGIKAVKTYFIFRKLSKKNISYKSNHYFSIVNFDVNNFVFNCKNYLQTTGWAMRTICTPVYANISIDYFEGKYIYPF